MFTTSPSVKGLPGAGFGMPADTPGAGPLAAGAPVPGPPPAVAGAWAQPGGVRKKNTSAAEGRTAGVKAEQRDKRIEKSGPIIRHSRMFRWVSKAETDFNIKRSRSNYGVKLPIVPRRLSWRSAG